ncbi:hypothetical protein LCGC14_0245980 [marine sediment metagenome]|uniref:Polydeoxyribonucleotide synthase [ATP] n=1 Tax=marine sediment metagenome TaxID=412755 RepID=A0A0F9UMH7_9ZZZZ
MDSGTVLSQTTGLFDGKKITTERWFLHGTNIGKANEKTPYDVAITEAEHRISKKKDGGYKKINVLGPERKTESLRLFLLDSLPDTATDAQGVSKPMKAKVVDYSKVDFPIYVQPKLNGVRLTIREINGVVRALSISGKPYDVAAAHIVSELTPHLLGSGLVLDGEFYKHGWTLGKIGGLARTQQFSIEHQELQFWVFDMAMEGISQGERLQLFNAIPFEELKTCHRVATHMISAKEAIKKLHDIFVNDGFEGAILRNIDAEYGFGKRDWRMQKVKAFMDEEFKITGGKTTPGVSIEDSFVFKFETKEGKTFYAKPKGTAAVRKNYASQVDSLVGKMSTVRFFEWTEDGLPHQGRMVVIRDYE